MQEFLSVDPLADQFPGYTPYNYTLNNPIKLIDPDGRAPQDIIINGVTWTPGASYDGDDEFVQKTFAALNSLNETIGAGNISTPEATGNVILDFVGADAPDLIISEAGEGEGSFTSESGSQIIWNPEDDIMVGPSADGKNVEGRLSSETQLGHEFGHAWLARFSPRLNAGMEAADARNTDPDRNEHNNFILPRVENRFSRARGEGVRNKYRGIYENKEAYERGTGSTGYGDYYLQRNN